MSLSSRAPKPLVQAHSRGGLPAKTRIGRGFSISELKAVGLNVKRAKRLGLKIDVRRRTSHEVNVNVLKEFLKSIQYTL